MEHTTHIKTFLHHGSAFHNTMKLEQRQWQQNRQIFLETKMFGENSCSMIHSLKASIGCTRKRRKITPEKEYTMQKLREQHKQNPKIERSVSVNEHEKLDTVTAKVSKNYNNMQKWQNYHTGVNNTERNVLKGMFLFT